MCVHARLLLQEAQPASGKAAGPPGGWQAWAQAVMQRLPGLSDMLLGEQEVRCCADASISQARASARACMHQEDLEAYSKVSVRCGATTGGDVHVPSLVALPMG